ncbi:YncE family protein [Paenibacillus silvisoli]|uniref:YncE family protein n=1 Tax=Paenibacillus silvisoli TaxID=3110539 RepID=UPI002803C1B8|nr:YncE family protein [Paenibacillus silvisoli]
MPVYDTGAIQNAQTSRIVSLSVRVFNTGRQPAIAGIEAYTINPPGDGFAAKTFYAVNLVSLNPIGEAGSSFTLGNVFANLDVFGIRVSTSGLGGSTVAVAIAATRENGLVEPYFLEGEVTTVDELLFAYVANNEPNVSVFNTGNHTLVKTIETATDSFRVAVAPDGTRVYVSDSNRSVYAIDTQTNTVIATITFPVTAGVGGLAVTPNGARVYVLCNGDDTIRIVGTATNTITGFIVLAPLSKPERIVFNTDGSRAYVCNSNADTVTVIDTATETIITDIPLVVGANPVSLAIHPEGTFVYTANQGTSGTSVIDTSVNAVVASISFPVGNNPAGVAITPDGSRLYFSMSSDEVLLFNPQTLTFVQSIILPTGDTPTSLAVTPDSSELLIACFNRACVKVASTETGEIVAIMPAGLNPDDIAITPVLLF